MKKFYSEEEYYQSEILQEPAPVDFGCGFCWDKKKQCPKELYFLDRANNMRLCKYCPSCGRKLEEEF